MSNYQSQPWSAAESAIMSAGLALPLRDLVRQVQAVNPSRSRSAVRDRRRLILGRHDLSYQPWAQRLAAQSEAPA